MTSLYWNVSPNVVPVTYVLDVTTGSGTTQMVLWTLYPNDGTSLTQSDADDTAAAMQSAVNGLSGVTGSTLTTLAVSGTIFAAQAYVLLDSATYDNHAFTIDIPGGYWNNQSTAGLMAKSPADGVLSSTDMSTVRAAIQTYIESLTDVTGCSISVVSVAPSSL